MESIPETGYGKLEKVQIGITTMMQGYKLRGKVDKLWANNTGETEEEQRRLNRRIIIRLLLERNRYSGRGSLSLHQGR